MAFSSTAIFATHHNAERFYLAHSDSLQRIPCCTFALLHLVHHLQNLRTREGRDLQEENGEESKSESKQHQERHTPAVTT